LSELGVIEDDLEVLNFRFKYRDMLMWPFIRSHLYLKAIYEMFNLASPNEFINKTYHLMPSYLLATLSNNPFTKNLNSKNDIIFFSTGIVNVKLKNDKYINRLYSHFALERPRTSLIIEDSFGMRYPKRRVFSNVKSHDYISIASSIRARLKHSDSIDKENIVKCVNFIKNRFLYKFKKDIWKDLTLLLEAISIRLPFFL
jgi:hypothetical protein